MANLGCEDCMDRTDGDCGKHDKQTIWLVPALSYLQPTPNPMGVPGVQRLLEQWQDHLRQRHGIACNWPFEGEEYER